MSLILGIDTGGTYTDGVIINAVSGEILHKAKALTTKSDLCVGIRNCMDCLGFNEYEDIVLVCLSTTLATNAIVEGRGCKAGLITVGVPPCGTLPTENVIEVSGKLDIKGRERENIVEKELEEAIEKLVGNVDAIAVSGYASVRNPIHELKVKSKIREKTSIPVVCAHELTSNLGYYERTITALLNAKLIPIIQDLMEATKAVLGEKGAAAPLMIVKGDGSLMHENFAKERPIETILSGPAASIIGGRYLSKEDDAIIFDMGGTTSDLAHIHDGVVRIKKEGACVGGWKTCVQAAEICTFGLGGDSHIYLDVIGDIKVGPKKVTPLSIAGARYPWLGEELETYRRNPDYELYVENEADCFEIQRINMDFGCGETELAVIEALREKPHSLFYLAQTLGKDPDALGLMELVDNGTLGRISVTPTDLLHITGEYRNWSFKTAKTGVAILAERKDITEEQFVEQAKAMIHAREAQILLESLAQFEGKTFDADKESAAQYVFDSLRDKENKGLITPKITINKPIIGIGAPTGVWLSGISSLLDVKITNPQHSEVANAVGAAVGQVMESIEVIVRPDGVTKKFTVFGLGERACFKTKEEATDFALKGARETVSLRANLAGSQEIEIADCVKDLYTENFTACTTTYVETKVKAVGVGKPMWK